jgi:kinesin family protein 6/9
MISLWTLSKRFVIAVQSKELEQMPKVKMLEDEHGNFHLKNLSMHAADTEEDALNLLFMGDTNRAIAETPMNLASSRSHCIFSILMEIRDTGSDRVSTSITAPSCFLSCYTIVFTG